MVFEVGIGTSQDWDPKKAAENAIKEALEKLNNTPKFVLLFTSIHYRKKGLKKILSTIYEHVEKDVPLIGGTVAGFISPKGVQVIGVGILAVYSDGKVSAFVENGTKSNPKKVGKKLGKKIAGFYSQQKNKLALCLISGPCEPTIMMNATLNRIFQKIPTKVFWKIRDFLFEISLKFLGYGTAREQDLFEEMDKFTKDTLIVGGSTIDDVKVLKNFQFYGKNIRENSIVSIVCDLAERVSLAQKSQLSETDQSLKVRVGAKRFCIDLINGKPAVQEYLNSFGLIGDYRTRHVKENLKTTLYYPLGRRVEKDLVDAFAIGLFTGNSIMSERKISETDLKVFYTSSKQILESFDSCIQEIKKTPRDFAFVCQGFHAIGILGRKINLLKKQLDEQFDNNYFLIFDIGEYKKELNKKTFLTNYGVSAISISRR